MGGPQAIERRDVRLAGALALGALGLRLMFLLASADHAWPHSTWYEGDAPVWVEWARALQAGRSFEFDLPVRAPGVAYLLSWIGGDLHSPFTSLKVVWCVMSAVTVGLTYLILRGELSRRASLIASVLFALSFHSYELATSLNNETPYLLVLTGAMALALWQTDRQTFLRAVARGFLHGCGVLLRPEHAVIALGLFTLDAWRARRLEPIVVRRRRLAAAISAALMFFTCLPWSLRSHAATVRFNTHAPQHIDVDGAVPPWSADAQSFLFSLPAFAREGNFRMLSAFAQRDGLTRVERADVERFFDENFGFVPEPLPAWTLSSSKGKLDLALANHLAGDGGFTRAALADKFDAQPDFAFGRASHLKLYLHGDAVVFDAIRSEPSAWLALVGRKLSHFANGLTGGLGARNLPFAFELVRKPVDVATAPTGHGLAWRATLVLTALAGVVLGLRRGVLSTWIWLLCARLAIGIVFYGYARQGALAAPAFFACFALAVDLGLDRATQRWPRLPRLAAWIGASVLAALVLIDVARFVSPPKLTVAPYDQRIVLVPTPQWGSSAFTSNEAVSIRE